MADISSKRKCALLIQSQESVEIFPRQLNNSYYLLTSYRYMQSPTILAYSPSAALRPYRFTYQHEQVMNNAIKVAFWSVRTLNTPGTKHELKQTPQTHQTLLDVAKEHNELS